MGVVGPSVADPVALGRGAVHEDVVGVRLPQRLQQFWRLVRQVPHDGGDAGMGGPDGYAEPGGDLRERVVAPEVGESYERTLVRRDLAAAITGLLHDPVTP